MRNSKRHNKLYNYLVNTLGISKQMVQDHIDMRLVQIDQKIEQYLKDKLNTNRIEHLILNRVTKIIKDGFEGSYWYSDRTAFDTFVKQKLKEVVMEHINDNYEIEVKVVKKEDKIIRKVET